MISVALLVNRTQWAVHLDGFDREGLTSLTRKPQRHEKALGKVCWAVLMVVWRAQQESEAGVVGMAVMNYID